MSWNWSPRAGFLRVVLPASVQCRKGISSVSVRLRPLFPILLLALALALSGCSNNSDRVTGNERLIRGPGGLGSTLVETAIPDRDTYVTPGTANYGSTLLVGHDANFEAQAFFKFLRINMPNDTLPGFTVRDVVFVIPAVSLRQEPSQITLELHEAATALADSGTIAWPGPAPGDLLASTVYNFTGFRMNLGAGAFTRLKQWTQPDPDVIPALMLRTTTLEGFAAFTSRAAQIRILYAYNSGTTTVEDSVSTTAPFDVYLHPPIAPAPTGSDTTLSLGGPFETSVAIRAPIPTISEGSSINDLRLVFGVVDSIPSYTLAADSLGITLVIDVYRVTGAWPEGATDRSQIPTESSPLATVLRSFPVGDTLSVPLPASLARGWTTLNEGVLLSVRNASVKPGLKLGSRESATVPLLRVGTTSAPPGRF